MKVHFHRWLWLFSLLLLPACTSRETKDALEKAAIFNETKSYNQSEQVLIVAIADRTTLVRNRYPAAKADDVAAQKTILHAVKTDGEVLNLEHALAHLYLLSHQPDEAAQVYLDILEGNPGDSFMRDALHDADALYRSDAIRVLGMIARPEAISALAETVKNDPDKNVRRNAVAALGQIRDPRVIPALLPALHDSYWFVRADAAAALGPLQATETLGPLFQALLDTDMNVQSAATTSLLFLARNPSSPVEEYARHLNDASPKISSLAAICCVLKKDARALPVLEKFLQTGDAPTRLNIVRALGQSHDPDAIPLLRQGLLDPVESVRGWSILGLGRLRDQGSLPALQELSLDTGQSPAIREAAMQAIQLILTVAPKN